MYELFSWEGDHWEPCYAPDDLDGTISTLANCIHPDELGWPQKVFMIRAVGHPLPPNTRVVETRDPESFAQFGYETWDSYEASKEGD